MALTPRSHRSLAARAAASQKSAAAHRRYNKESRGKRSTELRASDWNVDFAPEYGAPSPLWIQLAGNPNTGSPLQRSLYLEALSLTCSRSADIRRNSRRRRPPKRHRADCVQARIRGVGIAELSAYGSS